LVRVDAIEPIVGSDNCEAAVIGGWRVMVHKDEFFKGDIGIYFEIDSKVPETEEFAFLEKRKYKVKTQRFTFGGRGNFVSQGLLMHPLDFGFTKGGDDAIINPKTGVTYSLNDDSRFLTKVLNVTYAETEDNTRKANSADKYKLMSQRRPNLFKQPWARWMMKRNWGKKVMFFFFGKKKDKRSSWPAWVSKTDEERAQNCPWQLQDKSPWIATEKIDGSSTTATYRRIGKRKHEYYICSRNVVFDKPDKSCYYEFNPYTEMSEKYHFEEVLGDLVKKYNLEWATLQGETYGAGIQKRDYSLKEHEFAGFNLIFSDRGRLNSVESAEIMSAYGIPWVPIVDDKFIMPDTVDELLKIATDKSAIDGGMREGLVFRSQDGAKSFKAVSNEFLLTFHK
jgi:hypothetical protein